MKTSDLSPNPKNPRRISDSKLSQLEKSLKEFGDLSGILYNRRTKRLFGGHQRLKKFRETDVMIEKQFTPPTSKGTVAIGYVDFEGERFSYREVDWPENKEKLANIAANKGAGEWDLPELENWILDLDHANEDLELTMFDDEELKNLFDFGESKSTPEQDEKEDQVPEVKESFVKKGELWLLGEHRLLCGDSTNIQHVEWLMGGEKADMVFTDPPYGYKYESNHQTKHKMLKNDDQILDFFPAMITAMAKNSTAYVCGSHQTIEKWKPLFASHLSYKNLIVWMKNNWSMGDLKGSYAGQHELILFGSNGSQDMIGKRDSDVWQFDRNPPKDHPTQKPINLIEYALSKFQSGKVLDLFGGSGSTLIACEKTNRKCFMMEIDPHYCGVIIERWQEYTGQRAVRAQ